MVGPSPTCNFADQMVGDSEQRKHRRRNNQMRFGRPAAMEAIDRGLHPRRSPRDHQVGGAQYLREHHVVSVLDLPSREPLRLPVSARTRCAFGEFSGPPRCMARGSFNLGECTAVAGMVPSLANPP